MQQKALFLDRDGVINVDHGYVYKIGDFQFMEGIFDLARTAMKKNYIICVVTNQAGIGRGYYSEEEFLSLTEWMCMCFTLERCTISKVYYSPYHPIHGLGQYRKDHSSRKPKPGMLLNAINDFCINPDLSVLIGDKITDIQAGIAAGIGKNLLLGGSDTCEHLTFGSYTKISSLTEAAAFLRV